MLLSVVAAAAAEDREVVVAVDEEAVAVVEEVVDAVVAVDKSMTVPNDLKKIVIAMKISVDKISPKVTMVHHVGGILTDIPK